MKSKGNEVCRVKVVSKKGSCARKRIMFIWEVEMWGGSRGRRYRKPLGLGTPMFQEGPIYPKAERKTMELPCWRTVALSSGDIKRKWEEKNQEEIKTRITQMQK